MKAILRIYSLRKAMPQVAIQDAIILHCLKKNKGGSLWNAWRKSLKT